MTVPVEYKAETADQARSRQADAASRGQAAYGGAANSTPRSASEPPSGKKRKVASKAGEKRYGLPIGTELGKSRGGKNADDAQKDEGAKKRYEEIVKMNPADMAKYAEKLSDDELGKLHALAYSFKSSNATVVAARNALGRMLRRRGKNPGDYGALNAKPSAGKASAAGKRKPAGGSAGSKVKGNYLDLDDNVSDAQIAALKAEGWKGRPGDSKERLYRPGTKGADDMTEHDDLWATLDALEAKAMSQARREEAPTLPGSGSPGKFPIDSEATLKSAIRLHNSSDEPAEKVKTHIMTQARKLGLMDLVPDDWKTSGSKALDIFDVEHADSWLAVEFKRTTTKPSQTRKAQRAGKTIGKDKSDDKNGGDEYPIRTIGDVASAVKKAKAIKDPERKKEVMAHIRKGAAKINASKMVPSDSDSGSGDSKKSGPPEFIKKKMKGKALYLELADEVEYKVMSPNPNAARLRSYWAHGEGRAKWNPGTPGDFKRLRRQLKKYVKSPRVLNGLTANIHKLATGEWPGKKAHGKKDADIPVEYTGRIDAELLAKAAAIGDDDVEGALDRYAAMEVTSEQEYEDALANEVNFDLEPDGELSVDATAGGMADDSDDEIGDIDPDEWSSIEDYDDTDDTDDTDGSDADIDESYAEQTPADDAIASLMELYGDDDQD